MPDGSVSPSLYLLAEQVLPRYINQRALKNKMLIRYSGLMIKDDMANLGLGDVGQGHAGAGIPVQTPEAMATTSSGMGSANASTTTTTTSTGTSTTDQFPERI